MNVQRHQLIYVDSTANYTVQSNHPDLDVIRQQVLAWFRKGLPCVYARQTPDALDVNLGLPLIVDGKKHRVGLRVEKSSIIRQQHLPRLLDMHAYFSQFHGINDIDLVSAGERASSISIYGSFLFHYLSKQAYVDHSSDLDILVEYSGGPLSSLRKLLVLMNKKFNRTIDGEVRFPLFGDVAILELLDVSATKMVCKKRDSVEMLQRAERYERYPSLCKNGE